MKNKIILTAQLILLGFFAAAQSSTIHVSGRYILGPCNDTIILKGINYAPYNWGWSPNELRIDQIALSNANCVRLPWYIITPDGATPQSTFNNLDYLDSAISKCIQYRMIPIIELHDQTCSDDTTALISLANWYTQPSVLSILNKYEHSIIIDIANEALYVDWASNSASAQTTFIHTYTTIINNLRVAGITIPLMIDGPDCGTNLEVLANVGSLLETTDQQHNLIFSAHAYWYAYANNDSLQMLTKIDYALSKNIPFIFGEVANLQDDVSLCQYSLNYSALLNMCKQKKVGWLSWSWDHDGCSARQVTTTGMFNDLTTYGNDIINNTNYGLMENTIKSNYLLNNGCDTITGLNENESANSFSIFPNPIYENLNIQFAENTSTELSISNLVGEIIQQSKSCNQKNVTINIQSLPSGIYFLNIIEEGYRKVKIFVKQ